MSEGEKRTKLAPHPLVAALVDERNAPRDAVQLVGYVGVAGRADHVRLYATLELNEFVEVPAEAVLHHADVPDTELAHGGTRLWVDGAATLVHEVRQTTRTEARFLEGTIASENLHDAAPPAAARFGVGAVVRTAVSLCARCPPVTRPSQFHPCRSLLFPCLPTRRPPCTLVTCNPYFCGVVSVRCPSVVICPSQVCAGPIPGEDPVFGGVMIDPGLAGGAFGGLQDPWGG